MKQQNQSPYCMCQDLQSSKETIGASRARFLESYPSGSVARVGISILAQPEQTRSAGRSGAEPPNVGQDRWTVNCIGTGTQKRTPANIVWVDSVRVTQGVFAALVLHYNMQHHSGFLHTPLLISFRIA